MKKILFVITTFLFALVLVLALSSSANAEVFPDVIPLPDGFRPEGIVIGNGPTAYVGSLADGDIYAVNLRTGEGEVFIEGPGTPAVGLSFDYRTGYLYVSGGSNGDAYVYDTNSGDLVISYDFGGSFVNDAIVTQDAVFFSESSAPQLYRIELSPNGEPASTFTVLPLTGDYQFAANQFNANGLEALADGSALIVVNSFFGELYLVDPETGVATLIDLGGANANNGDGLLRVGKTLYVVQNFQNKIAEFQLSGDNLSASLEDEITDSDFDIPTTADNLGSSIYTVNARFSTPPGPDVTYDIVKVKR